MKIVVVLVVLLIMCDPVYASGGGGVGITSPPCGFGQPEAPLACVFSFCDCQNTGEQQRRPDYLRPDLLDLGVIERIDKDLDILYSKSFDDFANLPNVPDYWGIDDQEIRDLARE